MKPWEDLTEPLTFPIRGKVYHLPELAYQDFLTIQALQRGEPTHLDEANPDEGMRLVMGSMWDEMAADNVPAEAMSRAGLASLAFVLLGREMAEQVWEAGIDPKALAASIQEQARREQTTSTGTGSGNGTPSPASTTPTTSRRTSSKKKAKMAVRSRSSTSASGTGR